LVFNRTMPGNGGSFLQHTMKKPIILPALLFAALPADGATLFSSNSFTNTLGSNSGHLISNIGWTAEYGTSTSITTGLTSEGSYRMGVFDGTSASVGGIALNDYIYVQKWGIGNGTTLDTDAMLRTTALTAFAPASYTSLNATWHRNGDSAAAIRFMIQTGGSWYIADTATNGVGDGVTGAALSFNLLTSTWTNLGANVSIGNTSGITYSSLFGSGQTVTGIGLYIDDLATNSGTGLTTARFDNLTIEGVPEASTAGLAMLGLAGCCFRRKK